MELTAAVALVGAVLVPVLVALIVRPTWSPDRKRNWTIAVCAFVATVAGVATGQIETTASIQGWVGRVLVSLGVVISLSQGFYRTFKTPLDALERKTSPAPPAQDLTDAQA